MSSLTNAVTQSVLTRLLANIFAFLVLVSALGIAVYQFLTTGTTSPIIGTILGYGLGYAIHVLGINQGVTLEPVSSTKKEEIP